MPHELAGPAPEMKPDFGALADCVLSGTLPNMAIPASATRLPWSAP
jgi:hypothetical protein